MTHERDIERLLDRWLDDGPSTAPDRIVDAVADRIGRQRQRNAWRLLWRDSVMNPIIKPAGAVAAVALVAVIGLAIVGLQSSSNIGGPSPSPSPSASPPEAPNPSTRSCATTDPACTGLLDPGTHSTNALITPVTYTVPAGWSKPLDVPGSAYLTQDEKVGIIGLWPDWNASSGDSCISAPSAVAGHGRTVDDLVAWLTGHDGLVVSAPAPVTIDGVEGQVLNAQMANDYTGTCGGRAQIFTHQGTINDIGAFELHQFNQTRLYFFDLGEGHVLNIAIVAEQPAYFDSFAAAATPIVESVTFE